MDIYDLAEKFLKENEFGYDCLYNTNAECACDLDDLEPCGEMGSNCEFGFRNNCRECKKDCERKQDFDWTGSDEKCFVGKANESEGDA